MDYKNKYLKYKMKYFKLKGGMFKKLFKQSDNSHIITLPELKTEEELKQIKEMEESTSVCIREYNIEHLRVDYERIVKNIIGISKSYIKKYLSQLTPIKDDDINNFEIEVKYKNTNTFDTLKSLLELHPCAFTAAEYREINELLLNCSLVEGEMGCI
jgi:hypothetical protein